MVSTRVGAGATGWVEVGAEARCCCGGGGGGGGGGNLNGVRHGCSGSCCCCCPEGAGREEGGCSLGGGAGESEAEAGVGRAALTGDCCERAARPRPAPPPAAGAGLPMDRGSGDSEPASTAPPAPRSSLSTPRRGRGSRVRGLLLATALDPRPAEGGREDPGASRKVTLTPTVQASLPSSFTSREGKVVKARDAPEGALAIPGTAVEVKKYLKAMGAPERPVTAEMSEASRNPASAARYRMSSGKMVNGCPPVKATATSHLLGGIASGRAWGAGAAEP